MESGHTPSRRHPEYWNGDIPWIAVADARKSHGGRISETKEQTNQLGIDNSSARLLPEGTVCLARGGTVGYVVILDRPMATSQGFVNWICGPELDNRFLQYIFLREQEALDRFASGATVQTIYYPDVKAFHICIPPLSEQRRIVSVLDAAFAGLATATANTQKNLQNARVLFEAQLNRVFQSGGAGWQDTLLGSLLSFKHGFAFKGEFFTEQSDHVLLTPGNFYEKGGYRDRGEKQKYYDGPIPDGFILQRGDLLVAMTEQAAGLVGSPMIVPEDHRFLHNQRLGLAEPVNDAAWEPRFLYHLFNTKQFREQVHASASGVKVRHTSPKKMQAINVPYLTDVGEQRAVADSLDKLSDEVDQLASIAARKLDALEELKQSILHRAFRGELSGDGLTLNTNLMETAGA